MPGRVSARLCPPNDLASRVDGTRVGEDRSEILDRVPKAGRRLGDDRASGPEHEGGDQQVSYAYFYQAGGWNQNSRFDPVRAVTNDGRIEIDPYGKNTGDKAAAGGHSYCDKAPGSSFAAIPIVFVGRVLLQSLTRVEAESHAGITLLSYLATILTCGLGTALSALLIFRLAVKFGATPGGAAFAAIGFGLATPAWCYATLFIGHAFVWTCLMFAFAAAVVLAGASNPRRDHLLGAAVGLFAAWAAITESPATPAAAALAIVAIVQVWRDGSERRRRVAVGMLGASLPWVALLLVYNRAAFGSPFQFGYSCEQLFTDMKEGFFGITYPKPHVLVDLLFERYRGLLPLAPVLTVAPIGLVMLARSPAARACAVGATVVAGYYISPTAEVGHELSRQGITRGPAASRP